MKTRKKLLSFLLALVMLATALPLGASAAELPFTDVPKNAWYRAAVEYAYATGVFNGTGETTFSPNAPMTRAMFVQVLANKATNYNRADWAGKSSFTDVNKDQWYAPAVEWAGKAGLVNGTGNGNFSPEQNVTREQMATILYNYAKKTGNDTSFDAKVLDAFPDASTVSSYAREAMQWAVTHQVINGSDGKLAPKSNAKRCEVAQVAVNVERVLIYNVVEVKPEDPDDPEDPTPDDLPEGALTYQEFKELYSEITELVPALFIASPKTDLSEEEKFTLGKTGLETLTSYLIQYVDDNREELIYDYARITLKLITYADPAPMVSPEPFINFTYRVETPSSSEAFVESNQYAKYFKPFLTD